MNQFDPNKKKRNPTILIDRGDLFIVASFYPVPLGELPEFGLQVYEFTGTGTSSNFLRVVDLIDLLEEEIQRGIEPDVHSSWMLETLRDANERFLAGTA